MADKRPDYSQPRPEVSFCCPAGHSFKGPPDKVEPLPDREWHPWEYFATCPVCGVTASQASYEIGLFKAWQSATGPKTDEGKAASAKNLEGHPTPAEAQITRFNATKNGIYTKVGRYFPAKPGKYPACDTCEYLETKDCLPVKACLKQAEIMLRHQIAFETGDPRLLMDMQAQKHAAISALVDMAIMQIAADGGPRIKSVEWYYDKDGMFHLAKYRDENGEEQQIYKLEAHPTFKIVIESFSKLAMNLSDLGMTPKVQDEHDQMKGFIEDGEKERETEREFRQRQIEQGDELLNLINQSRQSHPSVKDITDQVEVTRDGE